MVDKLDFSEFQSPAMFTPSAKFGFCHKCKGQIDLFHPGSFSVSITEQSQAHPVGEELFECSNCAKQDALKTDRTIFPFADHMRAALEPYIQWRCETAIAQFVLEQAEMVK